MFRTRKNHTVTQYILERERAMLDPATRAPAPSVTLSREAGAGGLEIGRRLEAFLGQKQASGTATWTSLDRNLLGKVLEDRTLPQRLSQFMRQERFTSLDALAGEIVGLQPSSLNQRREETATILRLAEIGHVIIVGRGANFITELMPNVLHVRLVGSHSRRVARTRATGGVTYDEAVAWVDETDRVRAEYIRQNFQRDLRDPKHYHLVINTDLLSQEDTVKLIVDVLPKQRPRARQDANQRPPSGTPTRKLSPVIAKHPRP